MEYRSNVCESRYSIKDELPIYCFYTEWVDNTLLKVDSEVYASALARSGLACHSIITMIYACLLECENLQGLHIALMLTSLIDLVW